MQNLTLGLLDEGADGMTSQQIAEEQERLGAQIAASGSADRSTVTLVGAVAPISAPSLDLLADVVQRPDFDQAEIDRVRTQTLTAIAQAQKEPERDRRARASGAAVRRGPSLCDDRRSAMPRRSPRFTRDDLVGFQQRWLRPDNMEIFVVSNLPLAELQPQLEARFGKLGGAGRCQGRQEFRRAAGAPGQGRGSC